MESFEDTLKLTNAKLADEFVRMNTAEKRLASHDAAVLSLEQVKCNNDEFLSTVARIDAHMHDEDVIMNNLTNHNK
jgi:hypothetical protein